MKLKAVIIDDEPLAHDIIIQFAREIDVIDIVHQSTSAAEALLYLSKYHVDLLFVDINMPLMTGIDLIKSLNYKPKIIVTTAYEEYAVKSFELDVVDYLVKPFSYRRFVQAITKVLRFNKTIGRTNVAVSTPTSLGYSSEEVAPEFIFIKVDRKHVQVSLSDIFCFEAYGNYVKVWLDSSNLLTPRTLSSFEDSLPLQYFIRISKSVIVQKKYIHFVEGNDLKLTNAMVFPIGRSFKSNLSAFIDF